jgi:hypothetical protein
MSASPTSNIPSFSEESPADLAADEERDFILRLNGLSKALSAFVETYKNGRVDVKEVKALQKAMHDLEKSEWFSPPPKRSDDGAQERGSPRYHCASKPIFIR